MKLTHITVENYKGLRETQCKLSDFVCAIGENNAGKSSLLQSLLLFINGSKLTKSEFYDPGRDIVITVQIAGITEKVLAKLTDEHRTKIAPFVNDESIVLARRYATDGSSKLRVVTFVPRDTKYGDDQLDAIFKGKKKKGNCGNPFGLLFRDLNARRSITRNDPESREGDRSKVRCWIATGTNDAYRYSSADRY